MMRQNNVRKDCIFMFELYRIYPDVHSSSADIEQVLSRRSVVPDAVTIAGVEFSSVDFILKVVASKLRGTVRWLRLFKVCPSLIASPITNQLLLMGVGETERAFAVYKFPATARHRRLN